MTILSQPRSSTAGESTESSGTTLSFISENQLILFQYAEKEKWQKVKRILQRPRAIAYVKEKDSTGLTFLGLCVGLDAPPEILMRILAMDQQQAVELDVFGASALHIACLNGASVKAVALLVDICKDLVSKPDADDRLPIHHTADCLCRNEMDVNRCVDVMRIMLSVDPEIINAVDKYGDTPVDLIQRARCAAINNQEHEYNIKRVYYFLRETYVKWWRIKKVLWEKESTAEKDDEPPDKPSSSLSTDVSSFGSLSQISGHNSHDSRFQVSLMGGFEENGKWDNDADVDMMSIATS